MIRYAINRYRNRVISLDSRRVQRSQNSLAYPENLSKKET